MLLQVSESQRALIWNYLSAFRAELPAPTAAPPALRFSDNDMPASEFLPLYNQGLRRPEGPTFECRAIFPPRVSNPRASRDSSLLRTLKTIVAFYNTPDRVVSAYIIYGISERGSIAQRSQGIDPHQIDLNVITDAFFNFAPIPPNFWNLRIAPYDGKFFGVLEVLPVSSETRQLGGAGPIVPLIDLVVQDGSGSMLTDQVYVRVGSSNYATSEPNAVSYDRPVRTWFQVPSVVSARMHDELGSLDARSTRLVLLAGQLRGGPHLNLLATASWFAIIDADFLSQQQGLWSAFDIRSPQERLQCHPLEVTQAALPQHGLTVLPWIFARGSASVGSKEPSLSDGLALGHPAFVFALSRPYVINIVSP